MGMPGVLVGDITGDGCADLIGTHYYTADISGANAVDGLFVIPGSGSGPVVSQLKKYPKIHGDVALLTKPKAIAVALYPLDAKGVPGKGKRILTVPTGAEGREASKLSPHPATGWCWGSIQGGKVGKKRGAGKVFVLTFNGKGLK